VAMQEQINRTFFKRLRLNKNAFAMLMFEPMWGIPYNLFIPYMSLYMAALGCSPEQIGLVNTVGMIFQMIFSLLAPPITDRLGRNRTTLIFDIISWSGAVVIWVFANNFWFFIAAAVVQAINRIVHVSWNCLLIEDTDKDLLVTMFSWFTIAGLLSAVFSPLAAGFVKGLGVVPAMRWMMAAAFVLMTAMFVLRNFSTKETSVGKVRMEQSKSEPFLHQVVTVFTVTKDIWHNKRTLFFFILTAVYNAAITVKAPFFALLLTKALHFNDYTAGYFAAAASFVMLAVYLFAQPVLIRFKPKAPLSVGLILCAAGSLVLLPAFDSYTANLIAVIASVVLSSIGTAVAQPFIDGISHASIDNEKRSKMTSILISLTLFASAPFGLFGGWLFEQSARIPFLVATILFIVSILLIIGCYKNEALPQEQSSTVDVSQAS
jgi:MFS transporter, DHA1 family, tetracycline resistance protein